MHAIPIVASENPVYNGLRIEMLAVVSCPPFSPLVERDYVLESEDSRVLDSVKYIYVHRSSFLQ